MTADVVQTLSNLKPTKDLRIMDLVGEAGINVEPWSIRADGSLIETPAANPKYCYDWAFGGFAEPTALCVWHEQLKSEDVRIVYRGNMRELAIALDRVSEERFRPAKEKSRAKSQSPRAQEFDRLLQAAYRGAQPVRVVVLEGARRNSNSPGVDSSKVDYRLLDPESWHVESYVDDSGQFVLVRGELPNTQNARGVDAIETDVPKVSQFVDQFSAPEAVEQLVVNGRAYVRSPDVRHRVLERAMGKCELCQIQGFATTNGTIYLETHHVIPLSESGPDVVWNVVALCPNDHRRAHFALEREQIRSDLILKLLPTYEQSESLRTLRLAPPDSLEMYVNDNGQGQ
jgi:5-methylcytosine-specific restriction enzyme A